MSETAPGPDQRDHKALIADLAAAIPVEEALTVITGRPHSAELGYLQEHYTRVEPLRQPDQQYQHQPPIEGGA